MVLGMIRAYDKNNKEYAFGRPVKANQGSIDFGIPVALDG